MTDNEHEQLTADELQMAKSFGMTPEEYAAYKQPGGFPPADAYTSASEQTSRELDRAAEDEVRERIKAAVREALEEHGKAS